MDFDFSDDQKSLGEQIRRVLTERASFDRLRELADSGQSMDRDLWAMAAELGWLGMAVAEEHGGVGLGALELCVLMEEAGRVAAGLPLLSTICMGARLIERHGSDKQRAAWLPRLIAGEMVIAVAVGEATAPSLPAQPSGLTIIGGRLSGIVWPVPDAHQAQLLVLLADDGMYLVEGDAPGLVVQPLESFDPGRPLARLELDDVPAERLGDGTADLDRIYSEAAVLAAFEQIGGAQRCLEMATAYVKERYAFGRPLATNQAVKHKLADMLAAIEIARSHAYYAAWAMDQGNDQLALAAATARVAASDAFDMASRECLQLHGGFGFTWEADCHFFYRRAQHLRLILGRPAGWAERIVTELEKNIALGGRA